jgi:hypothetical protein
MGRLLPRGSSPPFSGVNRPTKSLPLPLTDESVAAVPPPSSHHVEAYPTENKKTSHSDGGAGVGISSAGRPFGEVFDTDGRFRTICVTPNLSLCVFGAGSEPQLATNDERKGLSFLEAPCSVSLQGLVL